MMRPNDARLARFAAATLFTILAALPGCGARIVGDGDATDGGRSCAAGETRCEAACIDVSSSAVHCGACGNACGDGESCVAG
ncbi:MAG: hypothetical protein M3Y87_33415, partial [Myxococcota bacterium]|nr:hypothetical protein [Myxococcota bacterium]